MMMRGFAELLFTVLWIIHTAYGKSSYLKKTTTKNNKTSRGSVLDLPDMSRAMRLKPDFCLCENRGADMLCSNSAQLISVFVFATQIVYTFVQNFKLLACFCDQYRLFFCRTWLETNIFGFLNFSHAKTQIGKTTY